MNFNNLSLKNFVASFWVHNINGIVHKKFLPSLAVTYIEEGYCEITFDNDEPVIIEAGYAYIMQPDMPIRIVHYVDPKTKYFSCKWIYVNLMLDDTIDLTKHIEFPKILVKEKSDMIGKIIVRLNEYYQPEINDFISAISIQRMVFDIFKELSNEIQIIFAQNEINPFLPALRYIDANLNTTILIEHLSYLCNMSASYFYPKFKKCIGVSPNKYITKKRLTSALNLLLTGDEKLSTIAQKTGFYDQFHLSHEFKKTYGQSPAEYKKSVLYGDNRK